MTKRKIKSKTKKIKISACYIVKNSAEDLKISIQSLKHAVDEIIVVDTGSTDNTVAVAKSFGAKIFFREWDDDFSAPRNLAISKATGDWIIFLDSDEFFSEETKKFLRPVVERAEESKVDSLIVYLANIDKTAINGGGNVKIDSTFFVLRIFKNASGVHYTGKIFEQVIIEGRIMDSATVPKKFLSIYHTGYSGALTKAKTERNLKILLEEFAETEETPRHAFHLAQIYNTLKDFDNAEKWAKYSIENEVIFTIAKTAPYKILLNILANDKNRQDELKKFLEHAIKIFPTTPEFSFNLANYYYKNENYEKALEEYLQTVEKAKNYDDEKELEETLIKGEQIKNLEIIIENLKKILTGEKDSMEKTKTQKNKLKISACYIVKNSAEDLKISIESLKHAVDEIIVVDTGSTDSTVEVAKSFGAKIFFREWDDDFSAPRNLAISKATGDWIIFLDSDEFFSEETKKFLRPAVERAEEFKKTGILIFLVNIDKNSGNKILDTNKIMRIFKNQKDLHYVGKIHEELRVGEDNLTEITVAPQNILTLYHTGYSTSVNKKKAERNLKMLLDELAETNEPQRIYGYIAECYNGLKDFVNAEKFARLNIDSMHGQKKLFATASYRIILNILADDKKRFSEREKFAELAVKDFPELPEFTAELAECYAVRGDFQRAIETMKAAIQKFKNYNSLETMRFNENLAKFAESRIDLWTKKIRG